VAESIFTERDGEFVPTDHARGPWDPRALHGGAPAALITAAFEQMDPGSHLRIARLGFELLRPIPLAPLSLSTRVVRAGRRVQELAAELHAGEDLICRANALRVQAVPDDLPAGADDALSDSSQPALPDPESLEPQYFTLDRTTEASFAGTGMEMRWVSDPWSLGRGQVWMRLRHPIVPEQPITPLARVAATTDFGNGVSAELPFEEFLFINADLTIHLHRAPEGEWIGLDARTLLHAGGSGLAESVIHDRTGPVGRAFQSLVVQAR
jgi:hypothetical protein